MTRDVSCSGGRAGSQKPRQVRPITTFLVNFSCQPFSLTPPPTPLARLLDEDLPAVYVANTFHEPRIVFHKGIPKVGAFFAATLKADTGRPLAVLAADSVSPPGRLTSLLATRGKVGCRGLNSVNRFAE